MAQRKLHLALTISVLAVLVAIAAIVSVSVASVPAPSNEAVFQYVPVNPEQNTAPAVITPAPAQKGEEPPLATHPSPMTPTKAPGNSL